jgi:hypothetical protein
VFEEVGNALFTLAGSESTSALRAGEGSWEGSLLASVTALGLCRLGDRLRAEFTVALVVVLLCGGLHVVRCGVAVRRGRG